MRYLILTILILAACGAPADLLQVPQPTNEVGQPPPGADKPDVQVFYLERKLGIDLPEPPKAQWFEGVWMRTPDGEVACLFYPGSEKCYPEERYFPPDMYVEEAIHVATQPELRHTQFTHALYHWALFHATGDPDEGHCHSLWGDKNVMNECR